MIRIFRVVTSAFLILLTGCSSLAPLLATPTSAPVSQATSTPQPTITPTATSAQSNVLRIWLPPQFDPSADTPAANLLKQRLDDFSSEHSGIEIQVRIKAASGDASLLNSLSATSKAAPSILPDLVALSRSDMASAAVKGLLHPIDGLTNLLDDPDWFGFAREFGHVQNTGYGLPFETNAMVILYRPSMFETPPSSWTSILESGSKMSFSASDPQAYFPIALYLSSGNRFTDDQGNFKMDEATLVRVLSLYRQALDSETVPVTVKDYQTDQQSLKLYADGSADLAVIWVSSDLANPSGQYAPLISLDDSSYTLADGWVWALAGSDTEKQALAVELASYLVDSDFMAAWTRASGYLPTRPQALSGWDNKNLQTSIEDVLGSAHPIPSTDVMNMASPIMQQALLHIFNGDQPEDVARSVIESLQ